MPRTWHFFDPDSGLSAWRLGRPPELAAAGPEAAAPGPQAGWCGAIRLQPVADQAAGLLTLPFREPLETWQDDSGWSEIRQRGISRHAGQVRC